MFYLLFFLLLASVRGYYECPVGYTANSILVYTNQFTRQQAVAKCSQEGAVLASITSEQENWMYSSANVGTGTLTFGLSCYDDNNCAFDDGTPYNSSVFNAFVGGKPKTSLGYCVAVQTWGSSAKNWTSIPCEQTGAFVCHYNPNSPISQQSGCNSFYVMDDAPLLITSPHYPQHYENFQACSYFIQGVARKGQGLNITFTDFHTEGVSDVVRIYFGGYRHNASFFGEYSGVMEPFTVITPSLESLITFTSDQSINYSGFSALVSYATK